MLLGVTHANPQAANTTHHRLIWFCRRRRQAISGRRNCRGERTCEKQVCGGMENRKSDETIEAATKDNRGSRGTRCSDAPSCFARSIVLIQPQDKATSSFQLINSTGQALMTHLAIRKERTYWPWLVLLSIPVGLAQSWVLAEHLVSPSKDGIPFDNLIWLSVIAAVVGVPVMIAIPHVRANRFIRGLPSNTYFCSRTSLQMICSVAYGYTIGAIASLAIIPPQSIQLIVLPCLLSISLGAATQMRFRKPQSQEFVVPNPWYKLIRPIIRGSRTNDSEEFLG